MAEKHFLQLFTNQTANGSGAEERVEIGDVTIFIEGVYDNAIVQIEHQPRGKTTWFPIPNGLFQFNDVLTHLSMVNADLPIGKIRANLSDVTGNTNIADAYTRPRQIDL